MSLIVSAYAASPAHTVWDPAFEDRFLSELAALPDVGGFELPWLGALHPHDDAWLLDHLPRGLDLVLTALPRVVARSTASPAYGLASADADGRRAALEDVAGMRDAASLLTRVGAGRVRAIELHTAPRGGHGRVDALAASLAEIASWDWSGAELVVEHCDAARPGQAFEKGFLTIGEEIEAIDTSGAPLGLWLNWGRSAIELRDPDAVAAQISAAHAAGSLTGLVFSGAAAVGSAYGQAWADAHLPIGWDDGDEGVSLLTPARVEAALIAASGTAVTGLKVSRRPGDREVETIVATIREHAAVIATARARADSSDALGLGIQRIDAATSLIDHGDERLLHGLMHVPRADPSAWHDEGVAGAQRDAVTAFRLDGHRP